MQAGLFDRVRQRCRDVAADSRHVHFANVDLAEYALTLSPSLRATPTYDDELHFRGGADATLAYVVALDAVNFGSGYFPHLDKLPGWSGYGTLALSLADWFRARGPLAAHELAAATPATCAEIFGQSLANPPIAELMALFARSWKDLGRDLLDRFGGSAGNLVEVADESAARLVALLDRQPLFRDVALYAGREVPFYKRAQILVSDVALAFGGTPWGRFRDLDLLTLFADNLVPHVLRTDGVLAYAPDLAARIARGDLIAAGSPEEVEIRACAVHAVELIVEALRSAGRPTTAREVDFVLWNRGQAPRYKAAPRHRTRTAAY